MNPPQIIIHGNHLNEIKKDYIVFLESFFRKSFQLVGTPIKVLLKNSENPFDKKVSLIDFLLFEKCWIDAVQWTYEDIIRDPYINAEDALVLKRKIDASNQVRTDTVEYIDSYFLD